MYVYTVCSDTTQEITLISCVVIAVPSVHALYQYKSHKELTIEVWATKSLEVSGMSGMYKLLFCNGNVRNEWHV